MAPRYDYGRQRMKLIVLPHYTQHLMRSPTILKHAPTIVTDWRTILQDQLAWQQGDVRIGWKLDGGALKRTMQKYAPRHQQWKRPVTHIALEDVETVDYAPHYENKNVAAFTIALNGRLRSGKIYQCKRAVSLKSNITL